MEKGQGKWNTSYDRAPIFTLTVTHNYKPKSQVMHSEIWLAGSAGFSQLKEKVKSPIKPYVSGKSTNNPQSSFEVNKQLKQFTLVRAEKTEFPPGVLCFYLTV